MIILIVGDVKVEKIRIRNPFDKKEDVLPRRRIDLFRIINHFSSSFLVFFFFSDSFSLSLWFTELDDPESEEEESELREEEDEELDDDELHKRRATFSFCCASSYCPGCGF